jgi:hypothetical protein
MRNMTIGQMIVYVFAFLVLAVVVTRLVDKYVGVGVAHQIFQAIADMFTGASK